MKRNPDIFIYIVLILSTWLVFGQVHTFDFLNYDDNLYVYENQHVLNGLTQRYTKPQEGQKLLLAHLKLELPPQKPPKIYRGQLKK